MHGDPVGDTLRLRTAGGGARILMSTWGCCVEPNSSTDPADKAGSADMSSRPSKRSIVIAAIAVVAVALVVGSLLSSRSQKAGVTSPSASLAEQVKRGDPDKVAAEGSELRRIEEPPRNAHVMISLPKGTLEFVFAIVFRPYGLAPSGGLVIRVESAKPLSHDNEEAVRLAKRLTGSNLVVSPGTAAPIASLRGGTYAGDLKIVEQPDAYSFELIAAEPK